MLQFFVRCIMIKKIEAMNKDSVIDYVQRFSKETFYFKKALENIEVWGTYYGFYDDNLMVGLVYFSQTNAMIVHFENAKISSPVSLLKIISEHEPQFIKGHTSSVAAIYKIIYRTLKKEKITSTYLMAFEQEIFSHLPTEKPFGNHDQIVSALQLDQEFVIKVEGYFERKIRPINDLLKEWIENSKKGNSVFYIVNNRPIAHGIIEEEGEHYGVIGGIYVVETYRKNGFGKSLSIQLTERLIRRGKKPFLFVKQNNETARQLYEKIGYKCIDSYSVLEIQR